MAKLIKKNTGKLYAHLVVDESGSMMADRNQTVEALNEYLTSVDQESTSVSITFFEGDKIKNVCECVSPTEAKRHVDEYQPNGMTNLFDAIGESIKFIDKKVKLEKNEAVAFVVITDGHENHSKEFKADDIKKLISQKENDDWLMIYLGADQDGFAAGMNYGFKGDYSATFNKSNLRGTFSDLASRNSAFAASSASVGSAAAKMDAIYSDSDRKELVKNKNTSTSKASA